MVRPIAGGVAVHTGEGSPLNKVAGIGFAGVPAAVELDSIEREFATAGAPVQVELSCLAEAGIGSLLTARGYRLVGFENVLGRRLPAPDLEPLRQQGGGIEVAPSERDELPSGSTPWPPASPIRTRRGSPRTNRSSRETHGAGDDGPGVGADPGPLSRPPRRRSRRRRLDARRDGICQLCGAATLPDHRRHGVQSAMLARRLDDATRAGCEVAVVTTLPGSKSQQNVQRLGFDLLYTRAILVLG